MDRHYWPFGAKVGGFAGSAAGIAANEPRPDWGDGETRVPEIEAPCSCAKSGSFSAKRSSSTDAPSLCPRCRSNATTRSHQIENVSFLPWERIASRRRPAFSSHLLTTTMRILYQGKSQRNWYERSWSNDPHLRSTPQA